jgi:hypothetical protein
MSVTRYGLRTLILPVDPAFFVDQDSRVLVPEARPCCWNQDVRANQTY